MALTKVSRGLLSTGIVDNSNATAITIDSSERVGIGTTTPQANLQVLGTIKVATGNDLGILGLGEASGTTVNAGIFRGAANNPTSGGNFLNLGGYDGIVFAASNAAIGSQTERMRIDSSGNMLIGQTSGSSSDAGHIFNPVGVAFHTRDGGVPLVCSRLTDNGDIAQFRKGSTVKGRIGTDGSDIFIGSDDTNLLFFQNGFLPANSVGGTRDNASDLGAASARFKDLYLSGGVFLGGTGSANQMQDYEEGAWTPTFQSFNGTFSTQSASYRKIGQTCFAFFHLDISTSHTGTNANLVVTGLPFATQTYGSVYGMTTTMHCNLWATANKADNGIMGPGSSIISFYRNEGQAGIYTPSLSDIGTGNFLCCLVFPTA